MVAARHGWIASPASAVATLGTRVYLPCGDAAWLGVSGEGGKPKSVRPSGQERGAQRAAKRTNDLRDMGSASCGQHFVLYRRLFERGSR